MSPRMRSTLFPLALAAMTVPIFAQEPTETKSADPQAEAQAKEASEKEAQAAEKLKELRSRAEKAEAAARDAAIEAQKARVEAFRAEQDAAIHRARSRTRAAKTDKYWIGVGCAPLPPALQAQLGLGEKGQGLLVEDLVPESPAAKAGVAQHDVLISMGDKPLNGLLDLIEAVQATEGKETTLTLIRGGKQQTLKVAPVERPLDTLILNDQSLMSNTGRASIGVQDTPDGPIHFVGPGVVFNRKFELPKNLSVTITRKDDGSGAQISITADGKTYNVTQDDLDKLPENLREHVRGLLEPGPRPVRARLAPHFMQRLEAGPHAPVHSIERQLEDLQRKIEDLQKAVDSLKNSKPDGKSGATNDDDSGTIAA